MENTETATNSRQTQYEQVPPTNSYSVITSEVDLGNEILVEPITDSQPCEDSSENALTVSLNHNVESHGPPHPITNTAAKSTVTRGGR